MLKLDLTKYLFVVPSVVAGVEAGVESPAFDEAALFFSSICVFSVCNSSGVFISIGAILSVSGFA